MERFRKREQMEFIRHVIDSLHPNIRKWVEHTHFITGYDYNFLGLHILHDDLIPDGRSFCGYGHLQWSRPKSDRRTTIVLMENELELEYYEYVKVAILHELGHAMEESIGWYEGYYRPLDNYAASNPHEAFATAFQSYNSENLEYDWHYYHEKSFLEIVDPYLFNFFEKIKRGDLD